jgi:Ca-activated chloride channel family protein
MTLARLVMLLALLQLPPAGFPPAVVGAPDPPAISPRRVTEGALFWKTGQGQVAAPVLATDVDIRVTGMIARAKVHQEFTNPAAEWAEGIYVFPLPDDAAVDHLRMRVGDRIIEGMIRERAAAKAAYTQARQQGQRTSLVEQERPNVFTTSVANIPPGAAITIEIEYQQTVHYDAGEFRLRFPMVVGPRYIPGEPAAAADGADHAPGTDQVPDASRISPPVRTPDLGPINPVRLRVELDPGLPLAAVGSSYHPIHTVPLGSDRHEITLAEQVVAADRDFELVWRPVAGAAPTATLLVEPKGEFMHALLMVMPPAASGQQARVPREVTFVLDHSGSMGGASIDQAKAALILALHRLTPADTFNVIRFNHRTDSLFAAPQAASAANVRAAERYVAAIRADGGTEMLPALERAFAPTEGAGRLRQVIFLTDGAVGNESRLFAAIRERLGDRRLFTIGIGSAPNSHFMREAARLGRGTFTYIGSPAEVQEKMVALFRKVEAPAVADITLELAGAAEAELLPAPIPDLYQGEPVVIALRARTLPAHVSVRGRTGSTAWAREVPIHAAVEGAGLSTYWACRKIAALLDQRSTDGTEESVRLAVIETALAYHLVSRYTSLVAVDVTPVRPADASLTSHALETNLPQGWDYAAVLGAGQGATPGALHLVLGLMALFAAVVLGLCLRGAPALVVVRRRRRED